MIFKLFLLLKLLFQVLPVQYTGLLQQVLLSAVIIGLLLKLLMLLCSQELLLSFTLPLLSLNLLSRLLRTALGRLLSSLAVPSAGSWCSFLQLLPQIPAF